MKPVPAWRRYLRFWRGNVVGDVEDELRFHVEMRVREYVARGMTEEDARRAVAARLGDVDAARSECVVLGEVREADARQADFFDALVADIRYALRSLGRTPGWTAVALLTIALGVGATTAVFRVADALLVRPFPYPDASRVFMARRQFDVNGRIVPVALPFGVARVWREHAQTIEDAALGGGAIVGLLGIGSDTVTVNAASVEAAFFAFARTQPLIGRMPGADEVAAEGPGALLLSEQFWRRHYGGSNDVIGQAVKFDNEWYTIVGVVPASLSIPDFRTRRADVLAVVPPSAGIAFGVVLVRLKPGVSREVATEELERIMRNAQLDDVRPVPMPMPLRLTRPQDWLAIRQPLVMLTGAVGLLLLVACTNVTHLLLARGAARQRELAVRHALGAGRWRLLRQLVTESVVLAAIGGGLAIVVGWAGLHLLEAARPTDLVALTHVSPDWGLLSIASAIAIVTGLAIGLIAAMRTAHRDLGLTLRGGASSVPFAGRRLRSALVAGEVALSAMLLVGALLLIHAVFDLQRTHLGFDARGLYSVWFPIPDGASAIEREAFFLERAAAIPGAQGVTRGSAPGPRSWRMLATYETPEPSGASERPSGWVALNSVAPDYFAVMGMPLLAGRTFDEGSFTRREVIIGQTLARQVWPDGIAVGRRLRNAVPRSGGAIEPWQTVIGVVPDVVSSLVSESGPGFYRPLSPRTRGGPMGGVTLVVRLSGDAAALRLRQFAETVHPDKSAIVITNVRENIYESMAEPRFTMRILVVFAVLGVVLAAIGLFGVISYSVGQRTREIGVRMTLGATRGSIARLVVGDGIRLAILGIGVGLLGAVAATRLIQSVLYGLSPFDPFSYVTGATVLLAVSVAACVVPMLRATGVDPAIAVRVE